MAIEATLQERVSVRRLAAKIRRGGSACLLPAPLRAQMAPGSSADAGAALSACGFGNVAEYPGSGKARGTIQGSAFLLSADGTLTLA